MNSTPTTKHTQEQCQGFSATVLPFRHSSLLSDQRLDQIKHEMKAVNLAEAKAHLSELVSKAQCGQETIITRRGQPVARLVPISSPKKGLRSLAGLRATLPKARRSSVELIRELRDEGY